MKWIWLILGVAELLLAGCVPTPPLPAGTAEQASLETYRLASGDKFRITVFNEPTLSDQEYIVDGEGNASLPLVGSVHVGGMTAAEAQVTITARYAQGFINDPNVTIAITSYRPFYIYGEVKKAGAYPYSAGLSVQAAIALAEGYSDRADQRHVYITRAGSNVEEIVELRAGMRVMPGDTIRIPERFF